MDIDARRELGLFFGSCKCHKHQKIRLHDRFESPSSPNVPVGDPVTLGIRATALAPRLRGEDTFSSAFAADGHIRKPYPPTSFA